MVDREEREEKLGHSVCLFQMRVSRKDESIDAESGVLFQSRCDCFRISNQRGARSAANQTDPGPEIRTNLQSIALAAVELGHPFLALRTRVPDKVSECRAGKVWRPGPAGSRR